MEAAAPMVLHSGFGSLGQAMGLELHDTHLFTDGKTEAQTATARLGAQLLLHESHHPTRHFPPRPQHGGEHTRKLELRHKNSCIPRSLLTGKAAQEH